MTNKPFPEFSGPDEFFFKLPPYEQLGINEEQVGLLLYEDLTVDGFCPYCNRSRPFRRNTGWADTTWTHYRPPTATVYCAEIQLICTRHSDHLLRFFYFLQNEKIQKIGQHPSFADIALDESKQYKSVLSKDDVGEFHRAIGLAAHNVGIGSFVYLRRIFERLIMQRYKDFQTANQWKTEDFSKLRMSEKVQFLADYLPPFLVKNAKIYSILSLGIHELEEQQCLAFFPILRQSLILILEEDKKKKQEIDLQADLERAISRFSAPTS